MPIRRRNTVRSLPDTSESLGREMRSMPAPQWSTDLRRRFVEFHSDKYGVELAGRMFDALQRKPMFLPLAPPTGTAD